MTKKLRKRIIIVLMTLFGVTLLGTLIAVNILNYNVNLKHQRMAIRDDVKHYGVEVFCGQVKNNIEISEYDYCTCVVLKDNSVVVMANELPGYSSDEMKKITKRLSSQGISSGSYEGLVFVEADRKSGNRVYIFSDNRTAKENSKNFFIFSVIIFVIGLPLLTCVAFLLSKWMIKPTEESIKAEKEFMSNVSHDLKTPITIIKANADMLESEYGNNKQIEYIRQETAKMSSMVNQTLTLLSIDSPTRQRVFEEFDLSSLIYEMVLPFESVAYE
ncbi:MAG: sensor histidine kinase, partial [Ruminococcus sp.]